jgi:hypothetical protein
VDESQSLKSSSLLHRVPATSYYSLLTFLIVILTGCVSPDSTVVRPTAPLDFQELVKALAQWRGLPVKKEIRLNWQTGNGTPSVQSDSLSIAPTAELERAYKSIGLVANDAPFGPLLSECERLSRLIFYDRMTGVVSLAPDAARLGVPLDKVNTSAARDLPPALAVAMALQEQHFDWRERVESTTSADRRSAFRALAGGDAALAVLSLGQGKDRIDQPARELTLSFQIAAEINKLAASLPDYLRRELTLPYRAGSTFAFWAFKARGWQGVNALYANPPLSTAEILHPENYFIQRTAPLRFFPAALLRRFKGNPSVEQSLGEDAVAGLLAGAHTEKFAEEAAAGWRGDRLWAFRDGADLTTVWLSSWATETHAREFLQAYRKVIESRHGVRFSFTSAPKNAPSIASLGDRRGWLLQNRGSEVLLVSAATASRLADLANDAWLDLEIDKEPMDLPFDWAKRPRQMSLTRR